MQNDTTKGFTPCNILFRSWHKLLVSLYICSYFYSRFYLSRRDVPIISTVSTLYDFIRVTSKLAWTNQTLILESPNLYSMEVLIACPVSSIFSLFVANICPTMCHCIPLPSMVRKWDSLKLCNVTLPKCSHLPFKKWMVCAAMLEFEI